MGSIYSRGKTYWIQYCKNGKRLRESSKSTKKMVAQRLLKTREGEIAQGKTPGIYFDKVRFDELAEDFLRDYRVNKKKSLDKAHRSINHLKKVFEGMRIVEITTPMIQEYIEKRLNDGTANATINRELSALKRLMNLGAEQTPPKVSRDNMPKIKMLKENNARQGFFEHGDFMAIRDALPEYLKGVITFAYIFGWRVSEIINLTWGQVDLEQGIVCLNPGETKNDEGRTVYLDEELTEIFNIQWELRLKKERLIPYVFLNWDGTDKIKDFRGAWESACKKTGINKIFHDLRRTAVRNMVRAGVPEGVAMKVSGHKTRSVFERYNIVSSDDLKQATKKQQAYLKNTIATKSATITKIDTKKGIKQNA